MATNDPAAQPANAQTASGDAQQNAPLKRVMGPKLLLLFIVGDILGTGVYALTGQVAKEVGGAAWLPFLVAFGVALLTALSYLELVTKYPKAAGAALYVHKAFGVHFLTFIVCFTVMCSGLTSAATASQAFAANMFAAFGMEADKTWITVGALGFMALVMLVNLRGASESVRANVVLTLIELSGLLMVILLGFYAMSQGQADFSRVIAFDTPQDKGVFLAVTSATALAFFAMVGFEDSVNMAEETHNPSRIFPKVMLTGLGLTAVIYVLVSICAVALVPVGELASSSTPLVLVVKRAAPGLPVEYIMPVISMFAVANSALINMMMASRLLYGMSRQGVLPSFLAHVHRRNQTPWTAILFTTALAFGLIILVALGDSEAIRALGGTTALLLLGVFAFVNVAVLVLRRHPVKHEHFRTNRIAPWLGAAACLFLVTPLTGRDVIQYQVAGWLLLLGVVMWGVTYVARSKEDKMQLDPAALD